MGNHTAHSEFYLKGIRGEPVAVGRAEWPKLLSVYAYKIGQVRLHETLLKS